MLVNAGYNGNTIQEFCVTDRHGSIQPHPIILFTYIKMYKKNRHRQKNRQEFDDANADSYF